MFRTRWCGAIRGGRGLLSSIRVRFRKKERKKIEGNVRVYRLGHGGTAPAHLPPPTMPRNTGSADVSASKVVEGQKHRGIFMLTLLTSSTLSPSAIIIPAYLSGSSAPVLRNPGTVHVVSAQKNMASQRREKTSVGREVSGSMRLRGYLRDANIIRR